MSDLYSKCAFDVTGGATPMMRHWRQTFASLFEQEWRPRAKSVTVDGKEYPVIYRNGGKTWLLDGDDIIVVRWQSTSSGCSKNAFKAVREWDTPNSDRFQRNLEKVRKAVAS